MPIFQSGTLNTTALVVPNLYVQIVPPQNLVLNGVPTNLLGVVGTASWGPINQPVAVGTMADYAQNFGPLVARKYDMGTTVAIAVQQGATNFRCVRVTDGSDTAASYAVGLANDTFAIMFTAVNTGSLGNQLSLTLSQNSNTGAWQLVVALPGLVPEVFSNITGATSTLFWQTLANAVNQGIGALRGASQLVVATLPLIPNAVSPTAFGPQLLAGGTDGAGTVSEAGTDTVTAATLVGQDGAPRTGMYALRSQGCGIAVLSDTDDSTQWTTQAAFGLSEGVYMILTGPQGQGQNISGAVATMNAAGLDSYSAKLMLGDWVYWYDQVNALTRLVSPQGFVAGRLANLSPEQSSLNKPLYNVIGTQFSGTPGSSKVNTYSDAELTQLFQSGIDVIANPQPGGAYWGVRCGHNTSSNPATNGDNYTRLTNYIAATLSAGMGQFVGQVINSTLFQNIRSTILSFLQNLLSQGILGTADGSLPYSVICEASNNPPSMTDLGFVQCNVQVQFQGINEKFIVNLEGGQTVVIQQQTLPSSTLVN
jgi:phage tail sheath protein FI